MGLAFPGPHGDWPSRASDSAGHDSRTRRAFRIIDPLRCCSTTQLDCDRISVQVIIMGWLQKERKKKEGSGHRVSQSSQSLTESEKTYLMKGCHPSPRVVFKVCRKPTTRGLLSSACPVGCCPGCFLFNTEHNGNKSRE